MDDLIQLAQLVRQRNLLEREITAVISRPAQIGHVGEYIAARIFRITLEASASHKGIDGRFSNGRLERKTVNIKWYALREGILDLTPNHLPDYYLVLTGPKSSVMTSRGKSRPWTIENVYLFEALSLFTGLRARGLKLGVATSVRNRYWDEAEIYPARRDDLYLLTAAQRAALALFSAEAVG